MTPAPPNRAGRFGARAMLLAAALAILTAAGVMPTPVEAATFEESTTLTTRPIDVRAYRMVMTVTKPDRGPVDLAIMLTRHSRGSTAAIQTHTYRFELSRDSFTISEGLGRARLRTGDQMGAFGDIDMRFRSRALIVSIHGDCGSYDERGGRLRGDAGSFTLRTRTNYFESVRRSAFKAKIQELRRRTDGDCRERERCRNMLSLTSDHPSRGDVVSAIKNTATGKVTESYAVVEEDSAPAEVVHEIRTPAPPKAFSATQDVRRAKLRAPTGQPFLTGSLDFTAPDATTLESPGCRATFSSGGQVTGNLTGHFDVGGDRRYTGGEAIDAVAFRSKRT